ncbi:beta-D-glucosyl crocetin beta-1,6-glucosyltransferase [Morus notabilis]|nr:beta-D-glucosyl crocetin beta-1,6-glucosyltransferase [Morus notabilis]
MSILMLPWLAHGHVSPYLELAKRLAEKNFHVYFCSTPANLVSIKTKIPNKYSDHENHSLGIIELVELHLPELPDLPRHYHTTNGLPPHLMPTLKKAFDMSSPSFEKILDDLEPELLIYDFLQPWAPTLASQRNIPAVEFLSCSASMTSFCLHWRSKRGVEFPFPTIHLKGYEVSGFNNLLESSANDVKDKDRVRRCSEQSCTIVLVKSFSDVEDKYIDYLSVLLGKKIVPVGSLVDDGKDSNDLQDYNNVIKWLDSKEKSSVVFVSFGSEYFLSKDEMREIAYGLELSGVSFIWVVRFPVGEKMNIEEALPNGFLKRVERKGMIIEKWAPQREVLKSKSIGGFVSHCGWSSVMESMKFGVPIIAMPMHLDQPINARLVEEVGVGFEVERDENGRIQSEELAKAVRKVVLEKSGESVRNKAVEMGEKMRRRGDEEMEEVVKELVQLCGKENLQFNV